MSQTTGERIKARRLELGWTLEVLAKKTGTSKGFLSDLENNRRKTAGGDCLKSISGALGLSVDVLISGKDNTQEAVAPDFQIPSSLATFAQQEGLSFSHTMMLLQLRRQIVAFRSNSKSDDIDQFDWKPFYEAVKPHLK